jgi:hypothetical protein
VVSNNRGICRRLLSVTKINNKKKRVNQSIIPKREREREKKQITPPPSNTRRGMDIIDVVEGENQAAKNRNV